MILEIFSFFSHYLTLLVVFPLMFGLGIYLSIKLNFVQFAKLKAGLSALMKKDPEKEGNISHFEALSAVLAGNLGTGNISGMAVALTMGGPGALFWMWIMASLGAIIKFAGCFLSLKYRRKNEAGEFVGGPMYYLSAGLGFNKTAKLFCVCTIIAAFMVGNLVQVNSMALPLIKMGISSWIIIIPLIISVGVVVLGGLQRFAKVVAALVPLMTAVYLIAAIIILVIFKAKILWAIGMIFEAALGMQSIVGGAAGFTVAHAITVGFGRGIFATDAGCGVAPILQAGSRCKDPVIEGIVGMIPPFIVMIICTITGLVLMVTGAWQFSGEQSTNMCTWAFEAGLGNTMGKYVVVFSLILFAYTTVITWSFCGEKACEYLFSYKTIKYFKYAYILALPIGVFLHTNFVWILADICIGMMVITNLTGVIGLAPKMISETTPRLNEY